MKYHPVLDLPTVLSLFIKLYSSYEKLLGYNLQWLIAGNLFAGISSDLKGKKKPQLLEKVK